MKNQHLNTSWYALFCLLAATCFNPIVASAQAQNNATLTKLSNTINQNAANKPVEKVYLQLDKNFFVTGETIWIKAYVFLGGLHQLSDWSKIVNIALVDAQGKTKKLIKLPVINGTSWGDITLSDSLQGGEYTIKAYTKWMQNDKADYFFSRPVTIVSGLKSSKKPGKLQASKIAGNAKQDGQQVAVNKPDLQFMPESGKLIVGIKSKVAFKAVGVNGLGIDVKGVVVDEQGKEITRFESNHRGMGTFSLYPEPEKTYTVRVTYLNGTTQALPLKVEEQGYSLSINTTETDGVPVRVSASANAPHKNLILLGVINGTLCYSANLSMPGQVSTLTIPKSRFPSGIVQFSLLSANEGTPLCERLVFIQNNDALKLKVSSVPSCISPRGLMAIELQSLSPDSTPVAGNFSVAVIAEDKIPNAATSADATIFSHILLTSDLKGNVENAPYYFDDRNSAARAHLDLLMLTQGYRKFDLQTPVNTDASPEKALSISGTVKDFKGKPVVDGKVTLFTKIDNVMPLDTLTDKHGRFSFNNLIFTDSTRFVVNALTAKKSNNVKIEIDKDQSLITGFNAISINKEVTAPNSDAQNEYIDIATQQVQGKLLKAVTVTGKKKPSAISKEFQYSNNLNGPGNADFIVRAADIENRGGDLATVLQGVITGVRIIDDKAYSIGNSAFRGGTNGAMIMDPMNIIYNGMNYGTNFKAINPADVETIEVLRTARFTGVYGSSGAPGILVITSKRNINNVTKEPGVIAHIPAGYYQSRTFYSPVYSAEASGQQADLRTTVYWQPNIYTAADGTAKISYYNSDLAGVYRVIVEGTDKEGRLGRQVLRYEVK